MRREHVVTYGIDTNVLVRFVVQDDKNQSALASEFIEDRCSSENPAAISLIVLCEFVWVLSFSYKYSRQQIAATLKQLLLTDCFDVAKYDLAWAAMLDYSIGEGDYADCVIARINKMNGAETTVTFDKKAARNILFTLLTSQSVSRL